MIAPPSLAARVAAAWQPRESLSVSEWADHYRVLGSRVAAEPGPYHTDRTPYLREIMDSLGDPLVREVVAVAPAQSGKSEASRNWLGWVVDLHPGPCMIVFPTESAAKENIEERVLPMFSDSPQLRTHLTGRAWDMQRRQAYLDTCTIYVGWAGSHQALATRPIQYVVLDEVDKYPPYRGKEADAISLARVRTRTYGYRGKVLIVSTPTIPAGAVMRSYHACPDRRTWHVHCPHCSEHHELGWVNVRWEGMALEDAESLASQRAAFDALELAATYEWPCCKRSFADTERWGIVSAGHWHQEVELDRAESIGYKISGLCTPWTSLTDLAREFVTAKLKSLAELQHFFNSLLGEPFWGVTGEDGGQRRVLAEVVQAKSTRGHPRGVVPEWARVLVAAADTGRREFIWVVRAYGQGYRSRLVDWGIAHSFDELRASTLDRRFELAGSSGIEIHPQRLLIDSGGGKSMLHGTSRTEEVYRFSRTDPERIMPIKGASQAVTRPIYTHNHTYRHPSDETKDVELTLTIVDVGYFKDLTEARINHKDWSYWEVCDGVGADYVLQVAAEHKTLIDRKVSADGRVKENWRWVQRAQGAPNHFWDAEIYSAAGAYVLEADREEPLWPTTQRAAPRSRDDEQWWGGRREGESWI